MFIFFMEALHSFCRLVFLVSENTSSDLRMVITRLAHSHKSQVKPILSKPLIILFGQENHKTMNNKLNDKKKTRALFTLSELMQINKAA